MSQLDVEKKKSPLASCLGKDFSANRRKPAAVMSHVTKNNLQWTQQSWKQSKVGNRGVARQKK